MRILFWNVYRNKNENIDKYIMSLVDDYSIDLLVLAEYTSSEKNLSEMLQYSSQRLKKCITIGSERIKIWSNYANVKPSVQDKYYSVQIIMDKIIVCGIHLMSDLYSNGSAERLEKMRDIMVDLKDIEEKIHSKLILVIGDFNEMPYDKGCLSANGFHALPVLKEDDDSTRTVNGKTYRKFYNPMWNFFGDFSDPPGTYYYQSGLYSPIWHILDQVIMSQELIPFFVKDELRIITKCEHGTLADKNGRPNKEISDHFPICCEIKDFEV